MPVIPSTMTEVEAVKGAHDSESHVKGSSKSAKKYLILIAIDASPQANEAFEWYLNNIHSDENDLLLVHIAAPPFVSTQQVVYMSGELWSQMLAQEKERIKELEDKYAEKMRARGASGRIRAVFDARPGEVLVEIAKKEKASLIVMGTRGLGAVRRTILGSVSNHVLHHVHCPVAIYRMPTTGH